MERFRLLLVTPEYHEYNLADEKTYIVEPIQFEVLASLLDKEKFEVRLLDLRLERSARALSREVSEYQPHVVGFSSWTMHVSSVRRQLRWIKQLNPRIITLVGGHHLGIAPWDFADQHADYLLMGEAYLTFGILMERLREREQSPLLLS